MKKIVIVLKILLKLYFLIKVLYFFFEHYGMGIGFVEILPQFQ